MKPLAHNPAPLVALHLAALDVDAHGRRSCSSPSSRLGVGVFSSPSGSPTRPPSPGFSLFTETLTGQQRLHRHARRPTRSTSDGCEDMREALGPIPASLFPIVETTASEPNTGPSQGRIRRRAIPAHRTGSAGAAESRLSRRPATTPRHTQRNQAANTISETAQTHRSAGRDQPGVSSARPSPESQTEPGDASSSSSTTGWVV